MTEKTSRLAVASLAFVFGFGLWASSQLITGKLEPWDAEWPFYSGAMLVGGAVLGMALPRQTVSMYLGLWGGQAFALWLPGHDRAWVLLGLITTGMGSLLGLAGYLAGVVVHRGWRESRQEGAHQNPESTGKSVELPWLNRLRIGVLRVCWLPPALWLGSWAYIGITDHWGAFAAAPLFMASIGLSLVLGIMGGLLFSWKAWRREFDPLLALCSLLAGSVFLCAL